MFHQPVFKKMTSAGLNSLQQKVYQISVKNRIFDDPFHKKGPVLAILVPGMIQQLHEAVEVIEAIEVVEAVEVIEAADVLRTGKSLLRTSKSSRSLNSALF